MTSLPPLPGSGGTNRHSPHNRPDNRDANAADRSVDNRAANAAGRDAGNGAGNRAGKGPNQPPESVALLIKVWGAAIILELIHQVLNIVLTLLNKEALLATARETASRREGADALSETMVQFTAYGSVVVSSIISLAIIILLTVMLWFVHKHHKYAGTGRRMLFAFSLYFVFRVLLVFMTTPAGSDAPDWLFMFDGSIQILVGVAAAMGLIFSSRQDTLDYTGELEQLRRFEQERAKAERERELKRADRDRDGDRARGELDGANHDGANRDRDRDRDRDGAHRDGAHRDGDHGQDPARRGADEREREDSTP